VIQRLRPAHSPEDLAEIYARPHDSARWHDHNVRVDVTIALGRGVEQVDCLADLSCGNAKIARAIGSHLPERHIHLGDLAPGYELCGPIEETLEQIPDVDLFVCSETIEHLDEPAGVLLDIRRKASHLVLSTPVGAWGESNREHYWAWDRQGVEDMLESAGWSLLAYNELDMRPGWSPYCFGIWALR